MTIELTINGRAVSAADEHGDMPLLWFLREELKLKGTKFGCGIGQCGACTVHANGSAVRSCLMTVAQARNLAITTIEGLAPDDDHLHPVQQAWIEIDVPQCGYCQTGQIMAAAALLSQKPNPTDDDIAQGMTNICRCGSYVRIRKAVKRAAAMLSQRMSSTERTA
jgi:isoquinoline 1-oxidoreductase alpha subunit